MGIREIRQSGPYFYTYSPHHPPIATVQPGETIAIHTVDAFENKMTPRVKKFADVCTYPFLNPQTGPIAVAGSRPGDTLVVKIYEIKPTRDHAVTGTILEALSSHDHENRSPHAPPTLLPRIDEKCGLTPRCSTPDPHAVVPTGIPALMAPHRY